MTIIWKVCLTALLALALGVAWATAAPQGPWVQPAADLSATGQSAFIPQITTAPDGTTTAVWQRSNGSNEIIQAATRPPGGIFGPAVNLSAAGRDAFTPRINTAPDGTTTAVWFRFNGSNYIIQAATRPPGGSFDPSADSLSAAGQSASNPQITTAPDGTTTAVWQRSNGSKEIIQAATRPPGGSFGAPVDLSVAGQDASSPQIIAGLDGAATAVWYRSNGSNSIIQTISTAQPSILLGTAKTGTGSGTVSSTPAGIDCGTDCADTYPSFTRVTLTAAPGPGSTFEGWGGACQDAAGNRCELTLLEDANVTAGFGEAKLRITKFKPKKPKVKRGKKVKIKVTGKNVGDATATNVKLCVKLNKRLKKKLKPKGKKCKKLGSLAPGQAKKKNFKLKATKRAKKGKKYKVKFRFSAANAEAVAQVVKVKVK